MRERDLLYLINKQQNEIEELSKTVYKTQEELHGDRIRFISSENVKFSDLLEVRGVISCLVMLAKNLNNADRKIEKLESFVKQLGYEWKEDEVIKGHYIKTKK